VDGRPMSNPLLFFAITMSLCAFIAAALYPSDAATSRPWVAVGLTMWSVLSVRIATHEWSPRLHESTLRTHLRRAIVTVFALQACGLTVAHSAELLMSSWGVMRAAFFLAGAVDLLHTLLIHLLYIFYAADQPTMPIAHSSGVRVGPPTFWSYLPCAYSVLIGLALNARVRARISYYTGAATLSIGLGQLGAGELPGARDLVRELDGELPGQVYAQTRLASAERLSERLSLDDGGSGAGSVLGGSVHGGSVHGSKGLEDLDGSPAASEGAADAGQTRRKISAELRKVERRMAQLDGERLRLTRLLAQTADEQASLPHSTAALGGSPLVGRAGHRSAGSSVCTSASSDAGREGSHTPLQALDELVRTFGPAEASQRGSSSSSGGGGGLGAGRQRPVRPRDCD